MAQAKKKRTAKRAVKKITTTASRRSESDALMEKLKQYVRAHAAGFLRDPNVTSVGIGYKRVDGKPTKQLSVQFSVKEKVAPESVDDLGSRVIPQTLNVGGAVVPTDVIVRDFKPGYRTLEVPAKDARRARADEVAPGMSVGNVNVSAGTLGTFVRDRQSGAIVMLSNWHVLQGPLGKIGDDIVQPGKFDDNRIERNYIGRLLRSHLGPAGDCAIASISGRRYTNATLELNVACSRIGEPELDDRVVKSGRTTGVTRGIVTRVEVNTAMDYDGLVQANVGGFEIGPDPDHPAADEEISRGGDSGSVWFAVGAGGDATDVMLGLHYAGETQASAAEYALACYAKSVMEKLEIEPVGPIAVKAAAAEDADELRRGFDPDFLDFRLPAPTFAKSRRDDLAELDGSKEIPYCHFSVWLSMARRYPLCVAWNIDGAQFKRLKRTSFRTDRRGELEEYQLTNDFYHKNAIDKGHVARRADLCWGSIEEARQGNYDSFYYTNIAPQHEAFNQSDDTSAEPEGGLWGRLENTVFDTENPHRLRVSLFGGPVFSKHDRKFVQNGEEALLPREYWKVVAFKDDNDGSEKVFGFILSQAALIEGFVRPEGLDFDEWVWARIGLADLQERTGVTFPKAWKTREVPFAAPESLAGVPAIKPILSARNYFK